MGAWRISVTRGAGGRSQDSADGSRKSESRNMPGRCKFQDAWLAKDIYKEWLLKDPHDIQLARCKACCKAIKLQTMGEAALTSHAVGNGHKAAVRKLVEGGSIVVMNVADHVNGYSSIKDEEEQVALILHLNSNDPSTALDTVAPGSQLTNNNNNHHPHLSSSSPPPAAAPQHLPRRQPTGAATRSRAGDVALPPHTPPRRPRPAWQAAQRQQRLPSGTGRAGEGGVLQAQAETELEMDDEGRKEQMESLEWERRMGVLAWSRRCCGRRAGGTAEGPRLPHERRYYGAKLRRMGQDVHPCPPLLPPPPGAAAMRACGGGARPGQGGKRPSDAVD
ncbi:hypothetical protein CRUP_032039 [Coryphaenoides rupestris]|nr:hypothetical protein CRUP_032039 [Coryphaenoides rupestris]